MSATPTASIYRMVMPNHLCPFGLKSLHLLARQGFEVEDHHLQTHEQTEAFKQRYGVDTTPQTWIGDRRIGGYDDLRAYFGKDQGEISYQPVAAVFGVALLLSVAANLGAAGSVHALRTFEWFVAISMTLLGLLKLRDVESFSTMFLNYDLLARRWVGYGYVYPYAETGAGLLMVAGVGLWLAAPVALAIGTVGAVSVFKAVYVDGRELRCACVGGDSNVPLGFISLTENLMMVFMGIWMPLRGWVF